MGEPMRRRAEGEAADKEEKEEEGYLASSLE
jgi:hypothetical protein